MKAAFTLAAAGATLAAAQSLSDLPECGQLCVNNMIEIASSELGCDTGDVECYCTEPDFGYGVRDCANQACPNESQASQVIQYGTAYCRMALNGQSPDGDMDSGNDNDMDSDNDNDMDSDSDNDNDNDNDMDSGNDMDNNDDMDGDNNDGEDSDSNMTGVAGGAAGMMSTSALTNANGMTTGTTTFTGGMAGATGNMGGMNSMNGTMASSSMGAGATGGAGSGNDMDSDNDNDNNNSNDNDSDSDSDSEDSGMGGGNGMGGSSGSDSDSDSSDSDSDNGGNDENAASLATFAPSLLMGALALAVFAL